MRSLRSGHTPMNGVAVCTVELGKEPPRGFFRGIAARSTGSADVRAPSRGAHLAPSGWLKRQLAACFKISAIASSPSGL